MRLHSNTKHTKRRKNGEIERIVLHCSLKLQLWCNIEVSDISAVAPAATFVHFTVISKFANHNHDRNCNLEPAPPQLVTLVYPENVEI